MPVRSKLVLVDDLAPIGYPSSAHIVSSRVVDFGDLGDLLIGHLDLPRFFQLAIPQEHDEGLHLKVDVLEERRSLDLSRLRFLFRRVLLFSEVLQELNHLANIELLTSLYRVGIQLLRRFKISVPQLPLLR
jgi:hypothetical protein